MKISIQQQILIALTLLLSGRAMTIIYISRAGGDAASDPPAAWLMPLIGDAVIGISAFFIIYLICKRSGLFAWTTIILWNALAIWDALSAYLVNYTSPWPSFFMIQMFGSSMFFIASAMHLFCIYILITKTMREKFLGKPNLNNHDD